MNLYMKLVEIRRKTEKFSKDAQAYGYKYVTGNQVIDKIKPVMDELNVLLVTSIVPGTFKYADVRNVEPDKYGKDKLKKDVFITAEMVMTWINAENPDERLEVPFVLCGQQDDISQSFGSGLTYSERYFLMKFFNVATDGDDPDKINSDKKNIQDDEPQPNNKPNQQSNPQSNQKLTEPQIKRLYAIANTKGKNKEQVEQDVLKSCKCKPEEMTKKQYEQAVKYYETLQ